MDVAECYKVEYSVSDLQKYAEELGYEFRPHESSGLMLVLSESNFIYKTILVINTKFKFVEVLLFSNTLTFDEDSVPDWLSTYLLKNCAGNIVGSWSLQSAFEDDMLNYVISEKISFDNMNLKWFADVVETLLQACIEVEQTIEEN